MKVALEVEPDAGHGAMQRLLERERPAGQRVGGLEVEDLVAAGQPEVPNRLPVQAEIGREVNSPGLLIMAWLVTGFRRRTS